MVIDEKQFRAFIANLDKYTDMSCFNRQGNEENYQILKNKVFNQLVKYIESLKEEKISRWKQLKLEYDSTNHK